MIKKGTKLKGKKGPPCPPKMKLLLFLQFSIFTVKANFFENFGFDFGDGDIEYGQPVEADIRGGLRLFRYKKILENFLFAQDEFKRPLLNTPIHLHPPPKNKKSNHPSKKSKKESKTLSQIKTN